jgi:DNA repair exonuclease SbcCD nuclease subunit
MPAFSFVHAADLHLDSPFLGLSRLPEEQSRVVQEIREATFTAFDAVIDLCIHRKADFLLVAGDVYDGADRSLRAQLRFRDGLRRLAEAGIPAYIVHGNHDPLDGWADAITMPDSVHSFGPDLESVVFKKQGAPVARIHGISYPTRKIGKRFGRGFKRQGEEAFQIGLLHCNAGGNQRHEQYAPRSVDELAAAGLDYWALGHIHESAVLRHGSPFIGYPGNTQGRHINEPGPRGCFFVRVNSGGSLDAEPEFIATDSLRWLTCEVDISRIDSMEKLIACIEEQMGELAGSAGGRHVICRVTVRGRGPLHRSLTRPNAAQDLLDELHRLGIDRTPFVWVEKLLVRTRPEVDLAARRGAQDFLGDLLRLIESIHRSPGETDALQSVLAELYEYKRAVKILRRPDDSMMRSLLDRAESLCVDMLTEDGD